MCLGVPGRVLEWISRDSSFASARVEFGGVSRVCSMACVPDAKVGDYVVVHAGIAITRVNEEAARRTVEDLKALGLTDELNELQMDSSVDLSSEGG